MRCPGRHKSCRIFLLSFNSYWLYWFCSETIHPSIFNTGFFLHAGSLGTAGSLSQQSQSLSPQFIARHAFKMRVMIWRFCMSLQRKYEDPYILIISKYYFNFNIVFIVELPVTDTPEQCTSCQLQCVHEHPSRGYSGFSWNSYFKNAPYTGLHLPPSGVLRVCLCLSSKPPKVDRLIPFYHFTSCGLPHHSMEPTRTHAQDRLKIEIFSVCIDNQSHVSQFM